MKRKQQITVDAGFDWDPINIDILINQLKDLKKRGATTISVDNGQFGIEIEAYYVREETDEEYQDRLDAEKRKEELELKKARVMYEILKKKFES